MNTKTAILAAAIGAVVAFAGPAFSADDSKDQTEKCFGVAKAGKNDCAGATHACQGQGKKEADAKEFVKLPKGTCERIVGGSLTAKS